MKLFGRQFSRRLQALSLELSIFVTNFVGALYVKGYLAQHVCDVCVVAFVFLLVDTGSDFSCFFLSLLTIRQGQNSHVSSVLRSVSHVATSLDFRVETAWNDRGREGSTSGHIR
jgi:hypothetical protein